MEKAAYRHRFPAKVFHESIVHEAHFLLCNVLDILHAIQNYAAKTIRSWQESLKVYSDTSHDCLTGQMTEQRIL